MVCQQTRAKLTQAETALASLTPQPDAGLEALVAQLCDADANSAQRIMGSRIFAEAADAITALRSRPDGEVKLAVMWTKTADGLPPKSGLRDYEQIECLIRLPNGDIVMSMWNCEHEC